MAHAVYIRRDDEREVQRTCPLIAVQRCGMKMKREVVCVGGVALSGPADRKGVKVATGRLFRDNDAVVDG